MKKVGLLAGNGNLPILFTQAARSMGMEVIVISLVEDTQTAILKQVANKVYEISVGQLDTIIRTLKEEGVTEVTMLGKVTKEHLFSGTVPDMRMQKLLFSLPDKKDDTMMLALVKELAGEGIMVFDQTLLIKQLMPPVGVLTKRQPTEAELADMEFGLAAAREIGRMDIGQTVVVKNRALMAVEAIEGTDACIKRGGLLGRGGVVVAKTAKPQQDLRFDVPAIGVKTLESMIEAKASALVIEAGKTLVVDQARVVQMADEAGIAIAVME